MNATAVLVPTIRALTGAFRRADGASSQINRTAYFNYNTSQGLLGARSGSPTSVTMSLAGGGTFSLLALDAASGDPNFGASTSILVTGNLFGGGTVSQTLTATVTWASYTLSGFSNLTSVVFSNSSGEGLSLDNIDTGSAVPEPSSLALVMAGGAALVLGRKRLKR